MTPSKTTIASPAPPSPLLGHPPRAALCRRWLAAAILLPLTLAPAQEALRNSLAGQAAVEGRHRELESRPYTVKSGDFRLLAMPSLGLDWNDNVNTSQTGSQSDFILRPMLQLNASYPLTAYNLLNVSIGLGYDKYFENDELSGFRLTTGSEVAFDIFIKDFRFDLHDRFQYTQDTASQGGVAGTGSYGSFENTVGLNTTWDLQDLTLTLSYDHQNSISSSDQFSYTDRATEFFVARAGLRLHPTLTAGLEGTVSFTVYDQHVLNDNTGYSAGVYADWQPGPYLHIQPRLGYTIYDFQQTSLVTPAEDLDAWYIDLMITHQPTDTVSYSLNLGHEIRLGIQSDAIEAWYLRPSITWNLMKDLTFGTTLFYEHGNEGQLVNSVNTSEIYDWYGGGLNLSHPLTKKLTLGLNYRLTFRSSNASQDYTQNLVGLMLTYQLQ